MKINVPLIKWWSLIQEQKQGIYDNIYLKSQSGGFKCFVQSGISGIVYDFIRYTGQSTFNEATFTKHEESLCLGGKVVIHLVKSMKNPEKAFFYFDNFFCSPELIYILKMNYGILSLGTLPKSRLSTHEWYKMKQNGCGSLDVHVDNNAHIPIVKWFDNKCVTLTSSFVAEIPISPVNHYCAMQENT